jgi:1-acyl-sn-glycerol-3-phosphate acyltransferase
MRNLLRIVGSIPKSKFIPDVETVHTVVNVIRKRGGVVGIFPEGTASFDGHTLPLIPSTAKLIKLLRVPVISVVLKGAYYSMPRWSWFHRRGRVEIHFKQALSSEEITQLSTEEIFKKLEASILHDEGQWEAEARLPFFQRALAENLETVLFQCPHCGEIGSMKSSVRTFLCTACGVSYRMDRFYRLRRIGSENGESVTIRDLSLLQEESFSLFLKQKMDQKPGLCLFSDPGVVVLRGRKLKPLSRFRTGRLVLFPDRIELRPLSGGRLVFPLSEVEGEGVFQRNNFEFYHNRILYQVRFANRSASALKWLMALRFLHQPTV